MRINQPATITISDLFTIRVDERVPVGKIMMVELVIAHRDGKTYETLPPSAVLALRKMRDE